MFYSSDILKTTEFLHFSISRKVQISLNKLTPRMLFQLAPSPVSVLPVPPPRAGEVGAAVSPFWWVGTWRVSAWQPCEAEWWCARQSDDTRASPRPWHPPWNWSRSWNRDKALIRSTSWHNMKIFTPPTLIPGCQSYPTQTDPWMALLPPPRLIPACQFYPT